MPPSQLLTRPAKSHHRSLEKRIAVRAWLRLLSCTGIIEHRVRTRLRTKFATTLPRFDVLAQLDAMEAQSPEIHRTGVTMSALSQRLMVTNGNLTGLIERLVREGLVDRSTSPKDRRVQMVRLTRAGRAALEAMLPEHHALITHTFSELTAEEQQQLYTLLGKLKHSLVDPWAHTKEDVL